MSCPGRSLPAFGLAVAIGLFMHSVCVPMIGAGQRGEPPRNKKDRQKRAPAKLNPNVFVKPLLKHYYGRFAAWDDNGDDELDKAELARAFRGARARPYDAEKGKNAKTLPDYQFLTLIHNNSSDAVSRKEYEGWVKKYAALREDLEEANEDYRKAIERLRTAKTASSRRSAQANLQKKTRALNDVLSQWTAIPPAIHRALNARR